MAENNKKSELVAEISKILLNRDPIGINFGMDDNEYKPEAEAIFKRIFSGIEEKELQDILYEVFVSWFSKNTAGKKDKYLVIAGDILDLINKQVWLTK